MKEAECKAAHRIASHLREPKAGMYIDGFFYEHDTSGGNTLEVLASRWGRVPTPDADSTGWWPVGNRPRSRWAVGR